MPTDAGRHHLYETVKHAWGADDADELMSLLPPVGWADVATKQDLALLGSELRSEMSELRSEMTELRGDLGTRIEALRAEMHEGFAKQSRSVVSVMVGLTAAFSAIAGLFTFLA